MIREIFGMIEAELGQALPVEVKARVELRFHHEKGGELHYVAKSPKRVTVQRITAYGTGIPALQVAHEVGVSPQYVRQIRRLTR